MDVDASDSRVGVLSQSFGKKMKIHLCSYFSCLLSLAEQSYDLRNRELLAVKLALKERRHWLEGAELSFIFWTGC